MERKPPVVAVVGPTATGKTGLAVDLARAFQGEIVSCDSMQIYRGLPIGTAQPTPEERTAAPHHLIGFLEVGEAFSVSQYVARAGEVIGEIHGRGHLPLVVGGTGLYARSLLRGFTFAEHARSDELRRELSRRAEAEGMEVLYAELAARDPEAAEKIHPNNGKRVLRALEYMELTGELFSRQEERSRQAESPYRVLWLGLNFRDREALYRRIDARVDRMLELGLLEEAEAFYRICQQAGTPPTAAQAIGYKELFPYFAGEVSLEEAVEAVKRESRRYAKRQITWFAREPGLVWLELDGKTAEQVADEAGRLVEDFLQEGETAHE